MKPLLFIMFDPFCNTDLSYEHDSRYGLTSLLREKLEERLFEVSRLSEEYEKLVEGDLRKPSAKRRYEVIKWQLGLSRRALRIAEYQFNKSLPRFTLNTSTELHTDD